MSSEPKYEMISVKLNASKPPLFVEKQNKDWIYFGEKNDYPFYLIELYRRSVMHSAIIDGKQKLICGQGWMVDGKGMNALEKAKTNEWIKAPNGQEDLSELTKKVAYDLEMFDGFYLQRIQNKGKTKSSWVHLPYQHMRSNKDNTKFYFTTKWQKTTPGGSKIMNTKPEDEEDFKEFKPYDPESPADGQVLFYKCYTPNLDVYPLPNYLAGINAIESEARIDNFWLNYIKRGFSASTMLNFYNGIPKPEEREKQAQQIKDKYTSDEGDHIIVNFCVDKDHGSEVISLETGDFDKKFMAMKESVQQSILTRHNVTSPELLGIKVATPLGDSDADKAMRRFQNWYVTPRQQIIEYVFNEIMTYDDERVKMKIKNLELIEEDWSEDFILKTMPVEALREMVANQLGIDLTRFKKAPQSVQTTQKKQELKAGEGKTPLWVKDIFQKFGRFKNEFDVIETKDFEFESYEKLDEEEENFKQTFAKDEVSTIGAPSIKLPVKGTPKVKTKVVYSYEGPEDDRNRAFCSEMLALDRYYTKDDMKLINAEIASDDEFASAFGDLDYNVWKHRGGWYRKAGTDVSIPHCRHRWVSHLVIVKG